MSQECDPGIVLNALETGVLGYVEKPRTQTGLMPAIEAVLEGKQFFGNGLTPDTLTCSFPLLSLVGRGVDSEK